jgi:outer membrane immunogenic protein
MKPRLLAAIAVLLAVSGSSAFAQVLSASAAVSGSASSWLAGAQAGYNWQSNAVVYGVEADIAAMHLNTELNATLATASPTTANANSDMDWYGTLRGRLGWSSGPFLFYGTAGLAYGRVELDSSISKPSRSLFLNSQTSSVRAGWVAGAGIDYLWRPNVILNVQYQYVDLGNVSLVASTTGTGFLNQSASAHAQFQAVTVGLSWLFVPNDGRRYAAWQGFYGGGRAGGAWGDNASANYSSNVFSCFTATTQILMADGTTRPIAAVKIGDEVLGENGEVNRVIGIETPILGLRKLYAFNEGPAFVTPEHPFMTRAGWKSIAPEATFAENGNFSVGKLNVGDEIVRVETVTTRAKSMTVALGRMLQARPVEVLVQTKFLALEAITPHGGDPSMLVYNLRLDGNHTYFANNYLVHNK